MEVVPSSSAQLRGAPGLTNHLLYASIFGKYSIDCLQKASTKLARFSLAKTVYEDRIFILWHLVFLREEPGRYEPEHEDSSGDNKGDMHARYECLLAPHKISQKRNSQETTNLSADI